MTATSSLFAPGTRRARRPRYAASALLAVALGLTSSSCDKPGAPQPARGPSATSTPAPPQARASRLSALPQGAAPAVAYVDTGTYVGPDRRSELRTTHGISSVAPYRGGFLVTDTRYFEGTVGLARYDAAGARLGSWCSVSSPVTGRRGRLTAWVTGGCSEVEDPEPVVVHRGATRSPHGGPGSLEAARRLDQRAVLAGLLGTDVVYTRGFGDGVFLTDLVSPPRAVPGLAWAGGVDEAGGLLAGELRRHENVGAVVDPHTGTVHWQVAHTQLGDFSPDGALVAGHDTRRSELGSWTVFDATTGARVADLELPRSFGLYDLVWEDARHLLGVATTRRDTAVVRVGLDGSLERATPVARSRPLRPAYVIAVA